MFITSDIWIIYYHPELCFVCYCFCVFYLNLLTCILHMACPSHRTLCSLVSSARQYVDFCLPTKHWNGFWPGSYTVHLNTFYVCKIAGFVKTQNKEIIIIITMQMFHTVFQLMCLLEEICVLMPAAKSRVAIPECSAVCLGSTAVLSRKSLTRLQLISPHPLRQTLWKGTRPRLCGTTQRTSNRERKIVFRHHPFPLETEHFASMCAHNKRMHAFTNIIDMYRL